VEMFRVEPGKSVAVVITTLNNAPTIRDCLDSLLGAYAAGEIDEMIVVDGHSIDGTIDIVTEYPAKLLFDSGRTSYQAREIGWRHSTADLILFLDADTRIGPKFFPAIVSRFVDKRIGVVGGLQKGLGRNGLPRVLTEWWKFHEQQTRGAQSDESSLTDWLTRLYAKAANHGELAFAVTGPCFMVRRSCLELVGGFTVEHSGDVRLSTQLLGLGWLTPWWVDAPVYRHPLGTVSELIRQRYRWGRADAMVRRQRRGWRQKIKYLVPLLHLTTIALAPLLTLKYRNPLHLWYFPVAQVSWAIGYARSLINLG